MDKPISVGDLVMVVRSCCGQHLGEIHPVLAVHHESVECSDCGKLQLGGHVSVTTSTDYKKGRLVWPPLSWLKRIPPIEELEGEKHDEEIAA